MVDDEDFSRSETENLEADSSIIKIRLDTSPILQQLETTLSGSVLVVKTDEDGNPFQTYEQVTEPKCNKAGYQGIMSFVHSVINTQSLQSYLKDEDVYNTYVKRVYMRFIDDLMQNLYEWGVDEDDYRLIVHSVMNTIELVTTQAIHGGTRSSISSSARIVEQTGGAKAGILGMFKKEK